MGPSAVVEGQIPSDPGACLGDAGIGPQVDLLIFDAPPQTLDEDVVAPSPLRADRQSSSPIPWGNRMQQDLCHRFAVDPKKTTSCTFAHTINMARPTDTVE